MAAEDTKYAVANLEDEEEGKMLENTPHNVDDAFGEDDMEADLAVGDSSLLTLPPRYPDATAALWRRYLWVIVPVVLLTGIFAFTGILRGDSHHKVTGPPPVLGVQKPAPEPVLAEVAPVTPTVPHSKTPTFTAKVIAKHPHDPAAFTQGLEYARGYLWESTGLRGESSLRRVRLSDGHVEQEYHFPDKNLFGEGMTLHRDHHIFMLSWRAGRGFIFDQNTFKLLKEWHYKGQGWGLTMHDSADEVWMSDGTPELRVLEPEHLTEKRRVKVTLDGKPVRELNEIEWVCGELWANVWRTTDIYRIDPVTGFVKSIIDLSNLPLRTDIVIGQNVLNGIAYDWESGRLWVTGKKWGKIYQIHVNDPDLDITHCKP